MKRCLKILILIITCATTSRHMPGSPGTAVAGTPSGAQDQGSGTQSIQALTRRLQKNRFDFVTWHKLGVAYYLNGMPAKAIKPLLYAAGKIRESSLNSLYLGLAYEATSKFPSARYWLQQASAANDESGNKALFELASIEYRARNVDRTIALLRQYTQRFPAGPYRQQADKLLASALAGKFNEPAPGIEKPDTEKLYYRNAKGSLLDYPHFWFIQTGFNFMLTDYMDPTDDPAKPLEPSQDSEYAILANAGIGVGPWREGTKSASGGYIYRQNYYTTDSRLMQFFDNPSDPRYFPFRFDLLKRRHTLFGDFRGSIANNIDAGVFGRHEIAKIGSQFFSGAEEGDLRSTLNVNDVTIVIPWIGTTFLPGSRTTAYLYMRKEINAETQDLSNQTFKLFTQDDTVMSFGASHVHSLIDNQLTMSGEFFMYEFIFNDFWLDFKRMGFFSEADYRLSPSLSLNALAGFYKDQYALPRVRINGNCNTGQRSTGRANPDTQPALCRRDDSGKVFQAGLRWNLSTDTQVGASLLMVSNDNDVMQEYSFEQKKFQVTLTKAFPSAQRVERLTERFADYVFFKEVR